MPFDPAKLHAFLTDGGLDHVGKLGVAGNRTMAARTGKWWAALPKHHWPGDGRFDQFVAKHWDGIWDDRRQELVFIGIGMDEARIRWQLDTCLVHAAAFMPTLSNDLRDPLPAWGERQTEAAE
ncbi:MULTISPECIES: GTP-binding protein [unclassified Sphingomonas]|uniref:GTP-binding protein n=1 Tax=unclassified Sphingomonas TaxID=196159 RepID=UPI0006FD2F1E|nr:MULTISPECIES: GTP-binding protein [unclassified Sphingomonas]KQM27397.1 hypothetical protein ASE58_10775 [Sphingomonas sp. Leaf9]KQM43734.1 hypothetical protein ASE57_10780 [Sphingomonas sp. Leaf11]